LAALACVVPTQLESAMGRFGFPLLVDGYCFVQGVDARNNRVKLQRVQLSLSNTKRDAIGVIR
jgi:hypothetical protein